MVVAIASHMVVAYAASALGVGLVQGMDTAIASHMVVAYAALRLGVGTV